MNELGAQEVFDALCAAHNKSEVGLAEILEGMAAFLEEHADELQENGQEMWADRLRKRSTSLDKLATLVVASKDFGYTK